MNIHNSVRAIIIKDGKILVTKNNGMDGDFYLLPGGGQQFKETFHEALIRECVEEVSILVDIFDVVFVREYIGEHHEFAIQHEDVHQIEYYFECKIAESNLITKDGIQPDLNQMGVEWLEIEQLQDYPLYPQTLKPILMNYYNGKKQKIYLGDIN